MYKTVITLLLLIVGLINFIPVIGVISAEQLTKLYGITLSDNNLTILLQHRALLFGIVGAFIIYAAFNPAVQSYAFIAGFITMLGFIIIAWKSAGYNQELSKIITMDIIALILLIIALVLFLIKKA